VDRFAGYFERCWNLCTSSMGDLMSYSHSSGFWCSTTTRHSIQHVHLCYCNKIHYILLCSVLSKTSYIYIYKDTGWMTMDSAIGRIYLGDPGIDTHHWIIRNTHPMSSSSLFYALLPRFHRSTQFVWFFTHCSQAIIYPHNVCGLSWSGTPSYPLTLG